MRLVYVATNRAHHYPYAKHMYEQNVLDAFITAFPRISPRAKINIGSKLRRNDFWQTIYVLSLMTSFPEDISDFFSFLSNKSLDKVSYQFASQSDVFLYYRTTGMHTTERIKKQGLPTICVLEEVNSHVEVCYSILLEEAKRLGIANTLRRFNDHSKRLDAYNSADYILCPSEWVRKSFIRKGFCESKLIKNTFGLTLPKTPIPKRTKLRHSFTILYVGQIHFRKGLRYLTQAFNKIQHPNKKLLIVGPVTPLPGISLSGLPENAKYLGVLKGKELENVYKSSDVFCLPSLEEGLALVLGEALAFGLPIVTTNQTGAEDLIENGQEGFIVKAQCSQSLLACLQELADNEELLTLMSHSALECSEKLGGWKESTSSLIEKLSQVVHSKTK
jgi:glycosyltransferase involved in cell wall biosynthesis